MRKGVSAMLVEVSNLRNRLRATFTKGLLLFLLLAYLPRPVLAGESLSLATSSGRVGQFTIPNSSPFTGLVNTRVELRVHSFVPPAGTVGAIRYIWRTPGLSIFFRGANPGSASPNAEICAADLFDSLPAYGNTTCVETRNASDLILRIRRDTNLKRFYLDAWSTASGAYFPGYCANPGGNLYGCPMAAVQPGSWPGQGLLGDDNRTDALVAWIKWYSTLGTGDAIPRSFDVADLADWTFDNTLVNSARAGLNISISGPNYFTTTPFPPVAQPRFLAAPAWTNWISPRAGFPVQLDASASYSNTSDIPGGLTFTWSQVDGPTQLFIDNPNSPRPVINGMVAGTYNLAVVVTDSNRLAATSVLSFGAVASDENGVVIQRDPWVDRILGPQLRFGLSPWPWFDERQKKLTEFYGSLLDTDPGYAEYWDATPIPGSLTLTAGSAIVTGVGTAFLTTFNCNGTDELVARWNGGVNRVQLGVNSCQSNTQLTVHVPWNRGPTETGLAFNRGGPDAARWYSNATSNNFYDNVMGHYAMYYRTGHVRYLTAARRLADAWWRFPPIDQGKNATSGYSLLPRNRSLTGLFLRGLDGRPEILDGMRALWENDQGVVKAPNWQAEDIREHGYAHYSYALAALYDRDPVNRAKYASYLTEGLANKWSAAARLQNVSATETVTWIPPLGFRPGTVTVQTGSTTVVGNATNWDAGSTCSLNYDWLYLEGDVRAYRCQYVSPTVLRLLSPYLGPSASNKRHQQANLVGAGTQPFMQGIAGQAMLAHAEVSGEALPARYGAAASQWLRFFGYRAATGGIYFGRLFPMCEPTPDTVAVCTLDADGLAAGRFLAGEIMGFLGKAYLVSKDDAIKALGDSLMTANFSKPGFPGLLTSGTVYNENFDDNALIFTAKKAKDFGFWWGFGGAPGWLGARLGGPQPPQMVRNAINFILDQIADSTSIRVKVLAPNAALREYRCTESPCMVDLDKRQGGHWITVDYLGSGDEVVAPGLPFLVEPE